MRFYEHGGDIYRNKNIRIDLSKSVNPLGMPQNVRAALRNNTDAFENYPDPLCELLSQKIAERDNIPAGNIVCGNGAIELIYAVCRAVKPKTAAVLSKPTFSEYENALRLQKCEIGDISDSVPDIAFVCTPNNPAGEITSAEKLKELSARVCVLAADESFIDFTETPSFTAYLSEYPNVVVIKSFTKIYSLAGLRLGYAVCADTGLLSAIRREIPCWSVSVPAQIAGTAALENTEWIPKTAEYVRREREFLISSIKDYARICGAGANFIFFETEKPLYEHMLSRGILVRRWDETHFRIAVSTRKNNEEFVKCLSQL